VALGRHPALPIRDDKISLTLEFADGSIAMIHYLANGNKGFPKERIEVFAAGRVLQLDNFLKLCGWGWKGFSKLNLWRQDKGTMQSARAFMDGIHARSGEPISRDEIFEISRLSIEAGNALC
jgi:hypothetical protein